MGWVSTKTHCQCNGNHGAPPRVQECVPSKELLSACAPIITTAVKSTCGVRRMFVSAFILIFLLAVIYWLSTPHQRAYPLRQPMRLQAQSSRSTGVPE
ncbi:uncharacterized protein LOC105185380 [Harpegnathos saltator]|uniref:uncharacterized protein LOC105185380 n=1 Tax=Harpegnathos saltator TaxID=610380 RepID=UPI00058DB925|nr:uncharacterized protein LOC105185380 [Harpegnathos saltator]